MDSLIAYYILVYLLYIKINYSGWHIFSYTMYFFLKLLLFSKNFLHIICILAYDSLNLYNGTIYIKIMI
jgi:hypothetical protein